MTIDPLLIAPISAVVSILFGLYFYRYVDKEDSGTEKMKEISSAIRVGAFAFLKREYTILAVFVIVVATLIGAFLPSPIWSSVNPIRNVSLSLAYMVIR